MRFRVGKDRPLVAVLQRIAKRPRHVNTRDVAGATIDAKIASSCTGVQITLERLAKVVTNETADTTNTNGGVSATTSTTLVAGIVRPNSQRRTAFSTGFRSLPTTVGTTVRTTVGTTAGTTVCMRIRNSAGRRVVATQTLARPRPVRSTRSVQHDRHAVRGRTTDRYDSARKAQPMSGGRRNGRDAASKITTQEPHRFTGRGDHELTGTVEFRVLAQPNENTLVRS